MMSKTLFFNKKNIYYLISVLFLASLILISNLVAVFNNCLESYDFGLYQQAIFDIAGFESFNPYLSIRGLKIFNDHFMPAIYFAAPFVWLFNFHPASLILFEFSTVVLAFLFVFKLKPKASFLEKLTSVLLILLSKGLLTGLIFPIHPGVWSLPLWICIGYYLYEEKYKKVLLLSSFLFLFRESFPFTLFGLSLFFLFKKEYRFGVMSFLIMVLQIILIFKVRPLLLGEVYNYGGGFISELLTDPLNYLTEKWMSFNISVPIKIYYPFILPFFLIIKKECLRIKDVLEHPAFGLFLMTCPLIVLHFLANKFHYQYGTVFVAPLLAGIIFSPSFFKTTDDWKVSSLVIVLFISSASSTYTKFFKLGILSQTNKCKISPARRDATKYLKEEVEKVERGSTIFSTKRIVSSVMKPGLDISVPYSLFVKYKKSYDYLLVEKNYGGDLDSVYSKEKFERIINKCNKMVSKKIIHNDHFYFARGLFTKECFSELFWENR